MKHTILIKTNDQTFKLYSLKGKSTLKNDFFQNKLRWLHKQERSIKCGCKPENDLWLAVVKNNDTYYLRTYPKITEEHNEECIFHNIANKFYDDDKEMYSLSIFQEVELSDKQKNSVSDHDIAIENSKNYTFNSFCQEWLSKANSYALNSANIQNEFFTENFTYEDFIHKFWKIDLNVSKIGNIRRISEVKGSYIKAGITYTDIPNLISGEDLDKVLSFDNFGKDKPIQVRQRRLNIASKKLKIFSNYIKPPYFFIAVLHYGIAVRLFLYPVYFDEEKICFVESEFERQYAKQLFDQKIAFLKPISDEYHQLNKAKAPYFDSAYRPDFFEFVKDQINIVELSGFGSKEYLNRLSDKKNDYIRIVEASKNNRIKFSYKEITMA